MKNGHAHTSGIAKKPARDLGAEQAFTMFSEDPARAGLTKREYFAARAMQAIVTADPDAKEEAVARDAVSYADALVTELAK